MEIKKNYTLVKDRTIKMKIMKKVLSLLMIAEMLVCFSGCANISSNNVQSGTISTSDSIGNSSHKSELTDRDSHEEIDTNSIRVGDVIGFGNYKNRIIDNPEEIEWTVLEVKDNMALLISKNLLSNNSFSYPDDGSHSIIWENCELRTWLNSDFLNAAFSSREKEAILLTVVDNSSSQGNKEWNPNSEKDTQDRVFLLSYAEAERYFDSEEERACGETNIDTDLSSLPQFAEEFGWWLRSPGNPAIEIRTRKADGTEEVKKAENVIAIVTKSGKTGFSAPATVEDVGIRPCLWIDLNSEQFKRCRKDIADGETITFGHYGKSNNPVTIDDVIEWIVLDIDGNKGLLFSCYELDKSKYHFEGLDVTWETCALRDWLNSSFFNEAFSEKEQKAILNTYVDNSVKQGNSLWLTDGGNNTEDKVFLLSYMEYHKYLSEGDYFQITPYLEEKVRNDLGSLYEDNKDEDFPWAYWLRSPGESQNCAAYVSGEYVFGGSNVEWSATLRPACWVNFDSPEFQSCASLRGTRLESVLHNGIKRFTEKLNTDGYNKDKSNGDKVAVFSEKNGEYIISEILSDDMLASTEEELGYIFSCQLDYVDEEWEHLKEASNIGRSEKPDSLRIRSQKCRIQAIAAGTGEVLAEIEIQEPQPMSVTMIEGNDYYYNSLSSWRIEKAYKELCSNIGLKWA